MTAQTKQFGLRAVAILLVVAFLVFGGIGLTGAAAQSSIPGDALYSVKTSIEQTRLSLAQDAGNRAQMKMSFAQERLDEIEALIQEGRFREVNAVVLAFESNINSAIVELEILSKADPARAAQLALEITATLSRYAQTLSDLVARVPESVKSEVNRALDTTNLVGGLEMPFGNENSNSNDNDDNSNVNSNDNDDDGNSNVNGNTNGDDDNSNTNGNDNDDDSNTNGDDDNSNTNGNDNDDDSNTNGDDDNSNTNGNDNDDDSNTNDNGDDDNSNTNDNGNDDNSNTNGNDNGNDDNSNDNSSDDNDNGGGSGGDDDYGDDNGNG